MGAACQLLANANALAALKCVLVFFADFELASHAENSRLSLGKNTLVYFSQRGQRER